MTTILISGASVAGPALAYWLRRFGFTPTVVERAPAPRPGGYAVDFRGASLTVLDRMGLLPAARARATDMGGMVYVDKSGRPVATTAPEAFSGELEVLRGDLVEILYAATRADVEYLFDDSIASLEQDEDGVQVALERGGSRRFDLVIGADGLQHSIGGTSPPSRRSSPRRTRVSAGRYRDCWPASSTRPTAITGGLSARMTR